MKQKIMNYYMNWLIPNTVLLSIHGSQAYGTSTSTSDVDVKGVVIPPVNMREHLFNKFEQAINNADVEAKFQHIKNPLNPKFESTVYSLQKFFTLAAAVNPNVIELFKVDDSHLLICTPVGKKIRDNYRMFISSRCKFTYSGYAIAQFYKIERHRKWILKGEIQPPQRKDYGLPEEKTKGYTEILRITKRTIEEWNMSKYSLTDVERNDLKQAVFNCIKNISNIDVNWANWPQVFELGALEKFMSEFNVSKQVSDLIIAETKYKNDVAEYENWLQWKNNRNLDRKKLEIAYNYDTKHASHLIRLMKTGVELLTGQELQVLRKDAQELIDIRNGSLTYDELKTYFDSLNQQLEAAYIQTKLPKSVNYDDINSLYHEICSEYISK